MRGSSKNRRHFKAAVPNESAAEGWNQHEPVVDTVSDEADDIVKVARSIELAREALEHAVEPLSDQQRDELAKRLGYDSFESLMEVSAVMTLNDGARWCLTRDRSGTWAAWNVCSVEVPRRFDTKDQAIAAINEE